MQKDWCNIVLLSAGLLMVAACRPEFRFFAGPDEVVESGADQPDQASDGGGGAAERGGDDYAMRSSAPKNLIECSRNAQDSVSIVSDKQTLNVGELVKFQVCCSLGGSNIVFDFGDDSTATPRVGQRYGGPERSRFSVVGYKYFIPGQYTVRGLCCQQGPQGGKRLQNAVTIDVKGSEDLYIRTHASDVGRGEAVRFHGWCRSDEEIKWDLGDGNRATGELVVHQYAVARTYKVTAQCGRSSARHTPAKASMQVKVLAQPIRQPQPNFCPDPAS